MSKERPISFTLPNVKLVRSLRKTQTRRLQGLKAVNERPDDFYFMGFYLEKAGKGDRVVADFGHVSYPEKSLKIICPFGKVGDILYVKEGGFVDNNYLPGLNRETTSVFYAGDELDQYQLDLRKHMQPFSARFMYKELARTWLKILDIRVERLQDITEKDAKAEGAEPDHYYQPGDVMVDFEDHTHVDGYRKIWEEINGPESWNLNPWVWVIDFKKI